MLKQLFIVLIVATSHAGRVQRWQTDYQKTISVQELTLRPTTFDAGDHVTLYATFDNRNNTINSGFIHYTIVHGDDEYEPQVDDLCNSVKCPLNKGKNEIELKFKMPLYLEPIKLYVELMDYSGKTFICGRINAKLSIWDWITSWVNPRPEKPIMDVYRSLRGTAINTTEDELTLQTVGPTAGMRPSSSSSILNN